MQRIKQSHQIKLTFNFVNGNVATSAAVPLRKVNWLYRASYIATLLFPKDTHTQNIHDCTLFARTNVIEAMKKKTVATTAKEETQNANECLFSVTSQNVL